MASSSSMLSREQFLCPICLDVFTRPVSTPCGHNFCMACLTSYWDNAPECQCPICKETFRRRPDLKVNTFISELVSQLTALDLTDRHIWSADLEQVNSGLAVMCDVCADTQKEAVKSCLECLTSYCDVHLEPHHRASGLKRHTLLEPMSSLEDKVCKEHDKFLVLFCRDDSVLLCEACATSRHLRHDIVPMQRAYEEMKDVLGYDEDKVELMIEERRQKVEIMKQSMKQSKAEAKEVMENGAQDLTALVVEIQKSQAALVRAIEQKQRTAEEHADGFISDMEGEVKELQVTGAKMRELKQTKDQFRFLQSYKNASLLPQTADLSAYNFNTHLEMQHIHRSVEKSLSHLRVLLHKMNTDIKQFSDNPSNTSMLRYMQQFEVNVVLDPETAHPLLILSDDGKQVRYGMGSGLWGKPILNPKMFTEHLAVLGRRGFMSRKFYFEVYMGQKTEWCLGVAQASVQRRRGICRSPGCGLWAIWFLEDKFETFISPDVTVYVGKVKRVGVFVDYDGGQISFYDVQTATLIWSFTECVFTEELYPYFNPCDNEYGANLDPMIIVPVSPVQ
ncbi:E3 ubiquitin-protein ligase TRIM21-like [Mugil cephalus]|uniref:E3 ubiquitin-protein ligase TRIM21-like n=1 Tax=Mugil cephalus TaxID=48193 RepID=UPI001FB82E3F|nr:E3 ubiquitin-protein ligase TRIM21-like [Mugil cephalus]